MSVCLSICPSHADILSKQLYISSKFFHQAMQSYLACAPPAALASCAAVCCVQDCDSRPLVLVQQCPGLPGQRLSAHCRRPCLTTAFCRHSNTRQSDVSPQDHKSGSVCRPISDYVGCHTASSGGYWWHFYSDSEATMQCELCRTEIFLLTYLLTNPVFKVTLFFDAEYLVNG